MSNSETSGPPSRNNSSAFSNPTNDGPEEGGGFWKTKIGGGAVGLWLLIALARAVPKFMEIGKDAPRPVVQQPPDMDKVHAILAGVTRHHVEQQVDNKAFLAADEAIRQNPRDPNAYRNRGLAWLGRRDLEKAVTDFTEAVRLGPKDAESRRLRAVARIQQGEFDQAIVDLDEAVGLKPTDAKAFVNRGYLRSRQRQYDKAIADYREANRLDVTNTPAYNGLAWIYATCPDGKYRDGKKAVENATRACKLTDMKEASFLDTLAAAYAETNDFDMALKCQWMSDTLNSLAGKTNSYERHRLYKSERPYRDDQKN